MPAAATVKTAVAVDPRLLERLDEHALRLGEIRVHLLTGAPFDTATTWPSALADVLDLLVEMRPAPRMVRRVCECGGTLQRTTAVEGGRVRPVIACTACEFVEVTR